MLASSQLVLAADDEGTDRLILKLAFERAAITVPLVIVNDGQEVIDYLAAKPPYTDRQRFPLPGLLLLDLKMPRLTGFDVLEWLALNREFRNLPAVIFSSSSHESDIQKARLLGAKDYVVKTPNLSTLAATIQSLCNRWMSPVPVPAASDIRKNVAGS